MPTEIGVHGVVRLVQSLACNGVELKRVRFIGHQTLQSSNPGAVLKAHRGQLRRCNSLVVIGGIVLQNSANERSTPKMGNIRIQKGGFLNQNSLFGT
jgi:hypothetical protein